MPAYTRLSSSCISKGAVSVESDTLPLASCHPALSLNYHLFECHKVASTATSCLRGLHNAASCELVTVSDDAQTEHCENESAQVGHVSDTMRVHDDTNDSHVNNFSDHDCMYQILRNDLYLESDACCNPDPLPAPPGAPPAFPHLLAPSPRHCS